MKNYSSIIISLLLIGIWSCTDFGAPCSEEDYDCNDVCDGSAVEDECGVCGGTETDPDNCDGTDFISYSATIQPIFNANCTNLCHTDPSDGGLVLSLYSDLMNGGNSGPAVIPNDYANSLLWEYINTGYMPMNDSKLPQATIDLIFEWINEGAENN